MVLNVFRTTQKIYASYIKTVFVFACSVSLPFALFEQYIFKSASNLQDRTLYGIVGIISSFIEVALLQLVYGYGIKKQNNYHRSLSGHIQYYFKHLIIETVRSYGKIALWSLLLLLPGLYKYLRLSLVGYVVQFSEDYDSGSKDALKMSSELTKFDFWRYSGTLLLTHAVIVGIQFYGVKFVLELNPLEWFAFFFFEISLTTFVYLFFFHYYQQLNKKLISSEVKNGSQI
jgi:hypothetical protein